jgi:DNA-binding response OmpR family regulator
MRVLIAEDDRVTRMILERRVARWEYDCLSAEDGETAWDLIVRHQPSLALVDWGMPRLDGPALCRRIRLDPAHRHMYLILLTAREARADVVEGLESGADDYLIKPFDPAELGARVRAGVRILTLQEQLAERIAELQHAVTHVKQLGGLLPICRYCKRIRSDQDYWEQIDSYLAEHTDAEIAHGICPACLDTAQAELWSR